MYDLDVENLEYKHFNERDVEIPAFYSFLEENKDAISSLLDIGGHYSWYTYADKTRAILGNKLYDAVDILDCPKTRSIVDNFIVGNVTSIENSYDCISCISTIEHAGVSTYKTTDPKHEIIRVFTHMASLAKHCLFCSFPFGKPFTYPNEYTNITLSMCRVFTSIGIGLDFDVQTRYYFNEFPQGRKLWIEVDEQVASMIEARPEYDVQCVAILTMNRRS